MEKSPLPLHRRSVRLEGYDYTQDGAYFVTIVTKNRESLFGYIANGAMYASVLGLVAVEKWLWLAEQYPYVELGDFCIMPNHIHAVLMIIHDVSPTIVQSVCEPSRQEVTKSLGRLIGAYKTTSTKWINLRCGTPGEIVWQRNYYEHIIRSSSELERISRYITDNPLQWELDRENPHQSATGDSS